MNKLDQIDKIKVKRKDDYAKIKKPHDDQKKVKKEERKDYLSIIRFFL